MKPSNKVARAFAAHYITTSSQLGYHIEIIEDCVRLWKDDCCIVKAYGYEDGDAWRVSVVKGYRATTPEARYEQQFGFQLLGDVAYTFRNN